MTGHRQPNGNASSILASLFSEHPEKLREYNRILGEIADIMFNTEGITYVMRGGVKRVRLPDLVTFQMVFASGRAGFNEDSLLVRCKAALARLESVEESVLKKDVNPDSVGLTGLSLDGLEFHVLQVTYVPFRQTKEAESRRVTVE